MRRPQDNNPRSYSTALGLPWLAYVLRIQGSNPGINQVKQQAVVILVCTQKYLALQRRQQARYNGDNIPAGYIFLSSS